MDIDRERQDFEKELSNQFGVDDIIYSNGFYGQPYIQDRWEIWLAAKQSSQKEIDELKMLLEDTMTMSKSRFDEINQLKRINFYNQLIIDSYKLQVKDSEDMQKLTKACEKLQELMKEIGLTEEDALREFNEMRKNESA